MKLGYETKADFQKAYFMRLAEKYFEGGNHTGGSSHVSYAIEQIVEGLSKAWDKAEEQGGQFK